MSRPIRVTVLSCIASPYQVEFFDAISADGRINLSVVYENWTSSGRKWERLATNHTSVSLGDGDSASTTATRWANESDLVICNWYPNSVMRELCERRLAQHKSVVLWGEAPRVSYGPVSRLRRRWLLRAFRSCKCSIWGIGSWAVLKWRNEFGAGRRYENLPYYSNLRRFSPNVRERDALYPARHFLFSGSLSRRKGVDVLAVAFRQLVNDIPGAQLTIIGDGPLEKNVREILAPLKDRVRFLGFCPWSELPPIYHQCDVLVAPSRYDGWGLIVPEGLASGLPVISTSMTGAAIDLVKEDENGAVVSPGSRGELFDAMSRIANHDGTVFRRMASQAVHSVASHDLRNGVTRFVECCRTETSDN